MDIAISSVLSSMIEQMPGPCAFKDQDSTFVYANKEFKVVIGLDPQQDLRGLTNFDLPAGMASMAEAFRQQDKYVMERQIAITSVIVHRYERANCRAFIVVKKPFCDQETNIRGVLFHGTEITAIHAGAVEAYPQRLRPKHISISSLRRESLVITDSEMNIEMTRRESEILYFLLRGGTAKRIANALSISSRTVEQYIEMLKNKFAAPRKSDLIEQAMSMGYLYVVPETLLLKRAPKLGFQANSQRCWTGREWADRTEMSANTKKSTARITQ